MAIANTHTLTFPAQRASIFVVDVWCGPQFECPTHLAQFTDERAAQLSAPLFRHVIRHGLHTRHPQPGITLRFVAVAFSRETGTPGVTDVYRFKLPLEELEAALDGGR